MDTRVWGPSAWKLLHSVAQQYPEKNPSKLVQQKYKRFFMGLKKGLPCVHCRISFAVYADELPIEPALAQGRKALSCWVFKIHNKVNTKLRKQGHAVKKAPRIATVRQRHGARGRISGCIALGVVFLGCVCYNHDPVKRRTYPVQLFNALPHVWPTDTGRAEWRNYLRAAPVAASLHSRAALVAWFRKSPLGRALPSTRKADVDAYFERFRVHKCSATTCRRPGRAPKVE